MRTQFTAAVAIALATGLSGTAAFAKHAPNVDPANATITPDTRICVIKPPITGSMLEVKECKTAAQWQKDGIDPAKLVAKKN